MKPVVVLTVCRRYHELDQALTRLEELRHEFATSPDVVVVWARPEVGRLWYFQGLLDQGRITSLLTRLPLPGEDDGRPTTYPESHNIRLGLEHVREHYSDAYVIVQSADILPKPGQAYKYIDTHINNGSCAVVFHWPNGCVGAEVWHTNFFGTRLDEQYWPPVCGPNEQDVLEWAWGKKLMNGQPPSVEKNHNSRFKRFTHNHLSETVPAWPVIPQKCAEGMSLDIRGHKVWWRRMLDWMLWR